MRDHIIYLAFLFSSLKVRNDKVSAIPVAKGRIIRSLINENPILLSQFLIKELVKRFNNEEPAALG